VLTDPETSVAPGRSSAASTTGERTWQEGTVIFLLRLSGVVTLCAFGAIFLPTEWMVRTHALLGLGDFPAVPVVDYLTRSVAALYAFHGGMVLYISTDVRRFRDLVGYFGAATIVFATVLFFVGLHAGLPLYWLLGEGPPVAALGLLIALLYRKIPPA
jgi:hypothetical protein